MYSPKTLVRGHSKILITEAGNLPLLRVNWSPLVTNKPWAISFRLIWSVQQNIFLKLYEYTQDYSSNVMSGKQQSSQPIVCSILIRYTFETLPEKA